MKTMKNFLSMAALALMGAMMTGCSNDDNYQQPENKSNVVTLTTTVGFADDGTTRALTSTGVKTFAEGETMAVIYHNGTSFVKAVSHALEAGDITNGGKNATFTFNLETPEKSGSVVYIYPAAMAGDTGVDFTKLNTQEGTFDALQSKYDLATNVGEWVGGNLPSLTLENRLAILAINLKNEAGSSDITSSITGLTVSDGTNTYNVSREASDGPIYVAILPTTSSAKIKIYASDGSNYYNKNLTGRTYAASNGYSVSWKMPEALLSAATTADYGMAVCAAGHLHLAKTAVPTGCTAVGIVGKVTETGHGLILALKDATEQDWNTINGWTSVTAYAGTTLKVLPNDAARGANLTSYTTLGATAVSNWAVAQKSDYEAIFINLGSTKSDEDGTTYDGNVNAYITTGVGGTAISGNYWSATLEEEDWAFDFESQYWSFESVWSSLKVRPVLGF